MKIICCGMPKTGTKSLSAALRILGFTVYDYDDQYWHRGPQIQKLMDEGCTTDEIREIFEEVDATADVPSYIFWEEILKAFPDTKLIFTEKENEDKWVESLEKQLRENRSNWTLRLCFTLTPSGRRFKKYYDAALRAPLCLPPFPGLIGGLTLCPTLTRIRYRQHNTRVLLAAPKQNLLRYNVREGWGLLCKFLHVPVPNQPFPHRNKGGQIIHELVDKSPVFQSMKRELITVCSLSVLFITVSIAIFLF